MTVYAADLGATLDPGESERFVVETRSHDAVRADFAADGTPYEVDIQTGSELNFPTYSSALPLGAEEFTDTNGHRLGTDTCADAIYVEVTNTSGSAITVDGTIDRHSPDASETVRAFLTKNEDERGLAYRDGELLSDAARAHIRALGGAIVSSEITSFEGSGLTVSGGSLNAQTSNGDDDRYFFGDDDDYFIEYDSSAGEWLFGSSDIDGNGTEGTIFRAEDGSQVLDVLADVAFPNITGTPTFGGHDHSEGGLAAVAAIANDAVGSAAIAADAVGVAAIGIGDGDELPFGSGDDITERFDSTADDLRWQDNTNAADRMALDRTTGDLTIEGALSEGAAL